MSADPFDLTGRTALVTGSSRGLGLAMARALGRAGARVVLNGRDAATLTDTAGRLAEEGIAAEFAVFDVTEEAQVEAEIAQIERSVGTIDILVNNAGFQYRKPLVEFEEDRFERMIETHLVAAFLVARRVAPGMIERRRGKIINICSLTSEVARPTISAYTAAKGGLKMLTRGMCADWARYNIQANGIGPGYFATEMNRALMADPAFDGWVKTRTPAGRWAKPDELGGAVVYLASAASDFVNGQILYVDGGLLAVI